VVLTVMVHANDIRTARSAVSVSGLALVTTFNKIGVAVARGSQSQVTAADHQPGVTYLEGNQPIRFFDETSNTATRGSEARDTLTGANGTRLDGSGVSVAVIDSGVDPTHPFLTDADGSSAVVRSLRSSWVDESSTSTGCIVDLPTDLDTDTLSGGGHSTHVNGIIAGRDTTLTDGTKLHGAAPGAKLVDISTGAVLVIIGADAALNWVLENHAHPCGAGVSASACPPIKVSNNSYGPSGGGDGPGPLDIATFNTISGTSMAAPHIAGIIAQLFQANPGATPAQVEAAMKCHRAQVRERRPLHRRGLVHFVAGQGHGAGGRRRGGAVARRLLTS
jgi:serine protease AprX